MPSGVIYKSSLLARRSVTLTLALLSLSVSGVKAQYRFDLWTTDNGLPQNSVNAILQTRDSYLWLATDGGLVRYDGARFTVFARGNTQGIESNRCSVLYEDRQGTLWIGTTEDRLISYRDGTFTTYQLKGSEVLKIEEDAEGNLWLTTLKNILCWKNGKATAYQPTDFLLAWSHDDAERIRQCHTWWRQDALGLHYFSRGRIVTYTARDGLPPGQVSKLTEDPYGTVWISTTEAGLVRVKDGRLTIYTVKEGLPSNNAPAAFGNREGNAWLLLGKDKLRRLRDGKLLTAPFHIGPSYEDREGTLWLGGNEGLAHAREMTVTTLSNEIVERHHIKENGWVYCILADRAGTIWLGEWGGGVVRYREGRFTNYVGGEEWKATVSNPKNHPHPRFVYAPGLFSAKVTSLYEDRAGVIWIGTYGGVSQFKDGQFKRYSDEHGLAFVWGMHQDRAGNMWFATDSGLTRYAQGSFTTYTTQDGLASNQTTALLEDHAGALWIGSHGGLTRYVAGHFTTWKEKDGFPNTQIRALYEDRDGVLWIGTYDSGLFRLKDNRFTRYTTQDGLFNNGVFQILEDTRGNFWMSSNLGLYRVRRQELNDFADKKIQRLTSIAYGKQDGMPNIECNGGRQPAGWKMPDGKLWFPTMLGVAIVDPETIPLNTIPPPVVIEEVQLDQKLVAFHSTLEIPPDKNNLEIRYTGLSFINSEQMRFKYQLAGVDQDWVEVGNRRIAYYSQLRPGTYTFTVLAANSDGLWNEQGQSLKVIVLPPFWRAWWFITLEVLTLIGAAFLLHQRRIKNLQRAHAAQETFSRRLIGSQEQERKRIAEGLHDSLAQYFLIIKNRADLALTKLVPQDQAQEHFDEISSLSAQAIEEVREIAHDLRPYQLDRFGLAKAIEAMLKKVAASSNIAFSSDLAEFDGALSKEAEINLYRIAQESVNNIVRHAHATTAHITLQREDSIAQLTIQDNGQGFAPEAATATSHPRGFGLNNIAERARLLGGKLKLHSLPGQGTTITLTFTLGEKPKGQPDNH